MSLLEELKRRNVFKAGVAYLALGWVVTQVTSTVAPLLHMPEWIGPVVVWIGVIGFPFVIMFSWIYELTPEGLKREREVDRSASITHVTSRRLDHIIIGLLVLAIGLFAVDRFLPRKAEPAAAAREAPAASATPDAAQTTIPPVSEHSIAVLPFVNMSSDKEQEYFSDGISEELLNQLAKIHELRVIARTSSFAFKGKEIGVADIARALNVANVLEGSIRKSGNKLRITAQLIRAVDSSHLWSETYDRDITDIFAVQDEISLAVVAQLRLKLLGAAPTAKAVNPQAYALFLQARQLRRQGTRENYEQAIALLQQALNLDANYAAAWNELGVVYISQASNYVRPSAEAYPQAREMVSKALAIDPNLARGHDFLGWIAMAYEGDLAAAAQHYQHALALEPTNADIIGNAAVLAGNLGRLDRAIEMYEWAVTQNPLSAVLQANLASFYLNAGRYDAAIDSGRSVLRLSPGYIGAQSGLAQALLLKDDATAARVEVLKETDELNRLSVLPQIEHALGNARASDAALSELIRKYAQDGAYQVAEVYAYRGEIDQAFAWLDKAVAAHVDLTQLPIDELLLKLKQDPRWLPFLRKLGKAPEQLAKIEFKVTLPEDNTASGQANP
jgi:TolB-like protein/Tfp pilus assembly protein PilF